VAAVLKDKLSEISVNPKESVPLSATFYKKNGEKNQDEWYASVMKYHFTHYLAITAD